MKSIELFAGIGGISLAAEWAGIETVAFCEREPFCQKILSKHWSDVPIFDDVKTLNKQTLIDGGVDVGTIDIISGGFPCQPYSIAGKRRGTEDDRDLWPEMFRIIEEIRPTWVVGENVANFVNMELDRTISDLESIGYTGGAFVIPAASVGAKHKRERTFIVAYSNDSRCVHRQVEKQPAERREHAQREPVASSANVANTSSIRLQKERSELKTTGIARDSENVSDSSGTRLSGSKDAGKTKRERENDNEQSSRCHPGRDYWAIEPDVGRVANGIPKRVDRIKGLGNAVVPQQIYPIFKAIVEIEKGVNRDDNN
ncbi:hypothetical protein J18TS1_12270 [Oceanobacillus oncorhynchi subsp. incaldanensis]|uniref:DNA cytosine methyltransferase n=1 Tax=Oceanobacillus oncorhynchi TaxID=545501 RepID=UPI001B28659A|nr:DNA (cytosine-5-)-methyltransferase [Oceanobacillus oncorhynchi]GIO18127.1 hypothetical protein J18TS1_12270 [Oceanobacillus oncorhynchi subsp. incaldanensis]